MHKQKENKTRKKLSAVKQSFKKNIKCRTNDNPYDGPVGFDSIRPGFNYELKYR